MHRSPIAWNASRALLVQGPRGSALLIRDESRHVLRATVKLRAGAAVVTPAGWAIVQQRGRTVVFERDDVGRYGSQWIALPHDAYDRLELTHPAFPQ